MPFFFFTIISIFPDKSTFSTVCFYFFSKIWLFRLLVWSIFRNFSKNWHFRLLVFRFFDKSTLSMMVNGRFIDVDDGQWSIIDLSIISLNARGRLLGGSGRKNATLAPEQIGLVHPKGAPKSSGRDPRRRRRRPSALWSAFWAFWVMF
jgi:hypothetical protein